MCLLTRWVNFSFDASQCKRNDACICNELCTCDDACTFVDACTRGDACDDACTECARL